MVRTEPLECPSQQSWSLQIGGPQAGEDQRSLLFTPDFPCGVERSAAFDPADDRPLQRIRTGNFCLGDGCDPSRMILIRGHVQSLDSVRGPGAIGPRTIDVCEGAPSQPRVKLEIWPCGWPGSVIVDSDSEIVVPAGKTSINVLAPGNTIAADGSPIPNTGGWDRLGRATLADATAWTDVTLRVSACPVDCCYCPEGVLTEWISGLTDAAPALADRILVRPRRARRLEVNNRNNANAPATITLELLRELSGLAANVVGTVVFPTTPATQNLVGAIQGITVIGQAAGTNALLKWEVR